MARTQVADRVERGEPELLGGSRRVAWVGASLCALATAGVYMVGASRSFDYDESVTVANFVRTPSLFAPFTRQAVFNNHVAFSALEHVVYLVTGSASEATMRALPIVCAAATVGLLVAWLARHAPLTVAVGAGALLAANPLFVGTGRDVRGYSLVCLCALASTWLLCSMLRSSTRWRSVLYIGFVALGLATNVYMAFVVVIHLVILARRHELSAAWRQRVLGGTILGASAYLGVLTQMADAARSQPRSLRPTFPLDLARALLGTSWPAVVLVAAGTAVTVWGLRTRRETAALMAASAGVLGVVWLVIAPHDLYPRLFVWACPAAAAAAALGLRRVRPVALAAAALGVAAITMGVVSAQNYTTDPLITREVASVAGRVQRAGGRVCGIGASNEAFPVYIPGTTEVDNPSQFAGCAMAIAVEPGDYPHLVADAFRQYPHYRWLPAATPGIVFWVSEHP